MTEESKKVLVLVSSPDQQRTPVGYHREFLELYQPNVTSYLTAEETGKLMQLGQKFTASQIAGTYVKDIQSQGCD